MEENLHGGLCSTHVKTEAVDEHTSAPVPSSREAPVCGGEDQTAEALQAAAAASKAPVLLYPVSTERFFTAAGDGNTYLKIAPASAMPPAPSDKTLPSGSDFSSKAVLCLIEAVGRRWGLYETRERSQLFQSVQEEMASKGHVLPVEKIRRKWNNLIVTYKRVKDRSRETGHAKTSWEFFDLMDATLCDTVGTQISNNKRHKGGGAASTLPSPLAKIAAKPPPPAVVGPNGDFALPGGLESVGQGAATSQLISSTAAMTSVATVTISPTNGPEIKPLIVLNGDIVTTSIHPATVVPSPSFISSPRFTETASTSPSLGSPGSTDLNASHHVSRKAPSFSPGVLPFRLSAAPVSNSQNLLGLSSSFSPMSSCLTSAAAAASLCATSLSEGEAQNQKGHEEQSSVALLRGILKRQEEQAHMDRVARRKVDAREKRRERREVRMAESLGRIATALELLSSKQDTVIALLQRLADRK